MPLTKRIWIPFLAVLSGCASTDPTIPAAWQSTPVARRVGPVALTSEARVLPASGRKETADVRIETRGDGQVLVRGTEVLTPPYRAIDSFDVSMERREVAFSAKRAEHFDVALVSLDGSRVNWVPEETLDETDPHWAKRGNKFAYVMRSNNGDLVRTVHVPTAVQLTIDFPGAVVTGIAWDDASERFAVVSETADASDRVEVMKYGGEERREVIAPAVKLSVAVEPFAPDAIALRPEGLRYNEKLPVVVWVTTGRLNEWSDARAALLNRARVACVVTSRAPDEAFWERVRATAWMDTARLFVVDAGARATSVPANAIRIAGDPAVPAGRYRRSGAAVFAAPAVVESFATGFVESELKGIPPRGNR